jgi:hypothetical protein
MARRKRASITVDGVTSNSRKRSSGIIGNAKRLARNAASSMSSRRSAASASASHVS